MGWSIAGLILVIGAIFFALLNGVGALQFSPNPWGIVALLVVLIGLGMMAYDLLKR